MQAWPSVVKEFRALFPMWIATLATIGLDALTGNDTIQQIAVLGYAFGSLALGAYVIGHEHTHRTLSVLLAQPVDRRRLLLVKLGVLIPMLALSSAGFWRITASEFSEPQPGLALVLLPAWGGLCVAPWLTMLTRNQLGGMMLTGMVGGWSLITIGVLTAKLSGLALDQAEQLGLAIWVRVMYGFAAVSAVLAWRTFMRLEAIEGAGPAIHLPRWFHRTARAGGSHPVWLLIGKELHLQQLTFVMAGLFVAGETVRSFLDTRGLVPQGGAVADALIPVYFGAVALVAGSLASAEERQFGMIESQQLLPMSGRQQWAIKASVAVLLALLLGLGVPAALIYARGSGDVLAVLSNAGPSALAITVLTVCGLYVSSLSSSGVRALALTFPFVAAAYILAVSMAVAIPRVLQSFHAIDALAFTLAGAGFTALLLWFAGANHRRTDRSVTRVVWQIGCAAAAIAIGLPLVSAILVLTDRLY